MKPSRLSASLLAFSLLLACGAVAAASNRGTLKIGETVTVSGQQLPAGKYEVEWVGSGPDVELSISAGTETLAKVPAQIVPQKKAQPQSGYSTIADQSGNKALTEIFFGGKKYMLSIGGASSATAASADQSKSNN